MIFRVVLERDPFSNSLFEWDWTVQHIPDEKYAYGRRETGVAMSKWTAKLGAKRAAKKIKALHGAKRERIEYEIVL